MNPEKCPEGTLELSFLRARAVAIEPRPISVSMPEVFRGEIARAMQVRCNRVQLSLESKTWPRRECHAGDCSGYGASIPAFAGQLKDATPDLDRKDLL